MNSLVNISSIDGRYNDMTRELIDYLSEYAFFKYRLKVEIQYFIFLNKILKFVDINNKLITDISDNFSIDECKKIKEIESNINHDVKSIEYYLIDKFKKINTLANYTQFIHFGLTSQDINNTSITLMIKDSISNVLIPLLKNIMECLSKKVSLWINVVMVSHTHGQPAVPTTLGKEFQVFHYRLKKQLDILNSVVYYGKFGGAVGNLNAHYKAYPNIDWDEEFTLFLKNMCLTREILTTQIDNYENLSVIFDCLRRINLILIDFNRDIWHYISIEYLIQDFNNSEIGSSTMPQKINPINFENSEGNLQLANTMLNFMSNKLPISRLQRDLTDSTILRNVGSIFSHMLIGYKNIIKGVNKLNINKKKIDFDINNNILIITEGLQTVMKKHGINNSYEIVKEFSRNNEKKTRLQLNKFITNLDISEEIKNELLDINQYNYIGNSNKIKLY